MEPTATYQGRMIVLNCTGSEITNLRVEHRCGQAIADPWFRSGLYGGKKSIQFPCAFSNACAHADLCEDRLSAITTSPG